MVEVARIKRAVARWGDRFLERVYTAEELAQTKGKVESLAARFAAKEAVMKALGVGPAQAPWRDIEVRREPSGRPVLRLHNAARKKAATLGIRGFSVSLSHTAKDAIAFAVGQKK